MVVVILVVTNMSMLTIEVCTQRWHTRLGVSYLYPLSFSLQVRERMTREIVMTAISNRRESFFYARIHHYVHCSYMLLH